MKTITSKRMGDVDVSALSLNSHAEYWITACGRNGGTMSRMRSEAKALNAKLLDSFAFGECPGLEKTAPSDGIIVQLHGNSASNGILSSIQSFAVSGLKPRPVNAHGREIGFAYEDEYAEYCRLSGVIPEDVSAPREKQAQSVLETMTEALNSRGFRFTDTIRTWFYLDRILDWYAEFNGVRTAFFEKEGVFTKMVPASTGIGAANPAGAALSGNLLAVKPKNGRLSIRTVESPLQNSAMNYRSSFSRAVELDYPTHRALLISGTASIGKDGKTLYETDTSLQIDMTMRVLEAILKSHGMEWNDVIRGIAYFKDTEDLGLFSEYCTRMKIPHLPMALAHADICRENLLFEVELDAAVEKSVSE